MPQTPRVLICDDSRGYRKVMADIVTRLGYTLAGEAANGEQAVEAFRQHQPDLMLLDINMPEKNGDEALDDILEEFPEALVIMLTSVAEMATVERCIEYGAVNYILKDTDPSEIEATIRDTWAAALEEM